MAVTSFSMRHEVIIRAALCTFACALLPVGLRAQDVSTSTTQKGASTYETTMKSGTVVYVSGNELVVRMDNGVVQHFTVPDNVTADVDGQQLNVHQLKPGMHLTKTITTKTTPTVVTTVRTIDGRVWFVNAPSTVILTLPDGTNKEYKVPKGQMFNINGQQQSVFQLRKGMNVSATVVTEEPTTVVTQQQAVTGVAPPRPRAPAQPMPDTVTVLLVESPHQPPQPTKTTQTASAEPVPKALPKTGSEWPLVGLLGLGSLGAGMLTRRVRMAWK